MDTRIKEHLYTKTQPGPSWTGITISDALATARYRYVGTNEEAEELLTRPPRPPEGNPRLAITVEEPGNSPTTPKPSRVVISCPNNPVYFVDTRDLDPKLVQQLWQILARRPLLVHDTRQVMPLMMQAGCQWPQNLFCLTTMARLVENRAYPEQKEQWTYDLASLCERYLPSVDGPHGNPNRQHHALLDKLMRATVGANLMSVCQLEHQILPIAYNMKRVGIAVNKSQLQQVELKYGEDVQKLAGQIRHQLQRPDLNLEANEAVLKALQDNGIQVNSTAQDDLSLGRHPVADLLIHYRQSRTLCSDAAKCLEAVEADGRIHPDWDPLGTGTGRFTCKNPPLQSLSGNRDLRSCFVPAQGHVFVSCDYAQADLRPIAFLSQDEAMLDIFRSGQDFHTVTAARLLRVDPEQVTPEQRKVSKAVVFGVTYGMGGDKLAKEATVKFNLPWTAEKAEQFIDDFYALYPGLQTWREHIRTLATTATEARTTLYRRRRLLPKGPEHAYYRFARLLNMPAQGTIADAVKEAMIQISSKLDESGCIVVNFHDELVVEVVQDRAGEVADMIKAEMQVALGHALDTVPVHAEARISSSLAK
jgi:DNA polymerase I